MATTRRTSRWVALAAIPALLLLPAAGSAQDEAEAKPAGRAVFDVLFDVVVLRPTGFVTLAVGSALCVAGVITASPGGRAPIEEAWDFFVVSPSEYVFQRPLGDF